jgi:hypothetical protein
MTVFWSVISYSLVDTYNILKDSSPLKRHATGYFEALVLIYQINITTSQTTLIFIVTALRTSLNSHILPPSYKFPGCDLFAIEGI